MCLPADGMRCQLSQGLIVSLTIQVDAVFLHLPFHEGMLSGGLALRCLVIEGVAESFSPCAFEPLAQLTHLQRLAILGCTLQDAQLSWLTGVR